MKAAWYERQGAAREVLTVGEMDEPRPLAGEVRIRVAASGVNPGDVKKRQDAFGYGMPYPRVIPHSDGAGIVDAVGEGVSQEWVGRRVWCYGAQTYRPFGTAAGYSTVPLAQAVPLPASVTFEQGACLGIPGITAHRAVHVAGSVEGRTVLVQGGAGAVGATAVRLARQAGARVIATCRSESDTEAVLRAGAHEVLLAGEGLAERIRALASDGVDHLIEVAFGANIKADVEVLAQGGSIATYATDVFTPEIPFWQLASATPASSSSAATTCRPARRPKPPTTSTRRLRPGGRVWRLPKGSRWTRLRGHTKPSNTRRRRGEWSSRPDAHRQRLCSL